MSGGAQSPDIERFLSGGDLPGSAQDGPVVLVDPEALARNIGEMATLTAGAAMHPHIKTHKSLEIAGMQAAAGAGGFTCATALEARVLLAAGHGPVTVARPILSPAIIAELLSLGGRLRLIADSAAHVEAIAQAAVLAGRAPEVFVKLDVGLHRMGVLPGGAESLALARLILSRGLTFAGLLSHAGNAYGLIGAEKVREVAASERRLMTRERALLEAAGIEVPVLSVGATPTALANDGFDGLDEVRPGNYVFLDLVAVAQGLVPRGRLSLAVGARVLAARDGRVVISAGSKALSSDRGPHGMDAIAGLGEAWLPGAETPLILSALSEEHGIARTDGPLPEVGAPVVVLPNHACPVVNLAGSLLTPSGASISVDMRR